MLENISQKLMGYRVQAAREAKGWTQAQLCKSLGLKNRQSISFIENGERALKTDELVLLTEALDYDIEFFLDPFSVSGEAKFSWRASPTLPELSLNDFEFQTGKWVGLLRWLREINGKQCNPLKYCLKLTKDSSYEEAIHCAEQLVKILDTGLIPANTLIQQIEKKLDIPVLFVDTKYSQKDHSISGATCHLKDLGVILLNRNESEARQFYNLAHELFHVLTWECMKPDHRESNSLEGRIQNKRIEQLADNFAAAMLMPQVSLKHFIKKNQVNDLDCLLSAANQLKVTPVALAWRLYNIKWIEQNILQLLKKYKISASKSPLNKRFQPDFIKMLHKSIGDGKLSARKAAKAMGMDFTQLNELFAEYALTAPFNL